MWSERGTNPISYNVLPSCLISIDINVNMFISIVGVHVVLSVALSRLPQSKLMQLCLMVPNVSNFLMPAQFAIGKYNPG